MAESKTSARRLTAAEYRKRATHLRICGSTYDEIGNALGISRQAAYKHVKRALEENRLKTSENIDTLREIERERLEKLIMAAMPKALNADIQAINSVRRLSESLRRLLGLDAPDRIEFNWRDEAAEIGLDSDELQAQFEKMVNEAFVNEKTTVSKSN